MLAVHRTRLVRGLIATGAALAVLAPAAASAAEIPDEGWEPSPEWDSVQDEFTAEAGERTDAELAEYFETWTFEPTLGFARLQNQLSNGLVHRKFRGDYDVAETDESLQVELYLPGGWDPGVQYTGEPDDRYLLHCQDESPVDLECVESDLGDGATAAWVWSPDDYIDAAVFLEDGSAVRIFWGADWDADDPALAVEARDLVIVATGLDTQPVWDALEVECAA